MLGLLSRGTSRLHPLHMTTLRLQMLLKQLCRQLGLLHLLGQETLLGQEALLLPQLQRRGPQTSGISQKAHQWQRQGVSRKRPQLAHRTRLCLPLQSSQQPQGCVAACRGRASSSTA